MGIFSPESSAVYHRTVIIVVGILSACQPCDGGLTYFVGNEAVFNAHVLANDSGAGTSLLTDDGFGIFGAGPAAGTGLTSVSRTGSVGSESFSYTVSDVNFKTGQPYGLDGGTLTLGDDILSNSTLAVESSVSQGGAGSVNWGIDSQSAPDSASSGGLETPNAAVFDFTGSATQIDHFGVNLHDFEAGFDNGDGVLQSGFVRIYDDMNNLIDNQAINFPATSFGDGETIHFGVFADSGLVLSKVVLVLGDDSDQNTANGWGGREHWAASEFTIGNAAQTPEPSSFLLLGMAGVFGTCRRRRRETDPAAS